MKKPKILFYDIETSPNLAYVWGKFEQDVIAYETEFEILSLAYKFQGQAVRVISRRNKTEEQILYLARLLFSMSSVIVAQNGDRFDYKKLAARMSFHGMQPPLVQPPSIDTLKVAKKYFAFNGNGLNDLGEFLKVGKKMKHPGFEMWLGCMKGDKKSWKQMEKYNKKDVLLLERVYNRMLPWIESPKKAVQIIKGKHK